MKLVFLAQLRRRIVESLLGARAAGAVVGFIAYLAASSLAWPAAPRETVIVGVYQNNPKVFIEPDGSPAGIFIDLIREIADEEDWELSFVPGTWIECLERLERGDIDLMPDVAYTAQRAQSYRFGSQSALSDWFQVFVRRGVAIDTILDLADKRVAVLEGSVQHEAFVNLTRGFEIDYEIVPAPDYPAAFELTRAGDVDALIVNRFSIYAYHGRDIRPTPIVFNPTRLHIAASPLADPRLLYAIDSRLAEWKSDAKSVLYESLKRWTGEAPPKSMPAYVIWLLAIGGALLVAVGAAAYILRRQVAHRTKDLGVRSAELESAQSSLRHAEGQAARQERLHALGKMVSGVAHDFNNVLMPITGYAQLLLDHPRELENRELVEESLRLILEAGQDGAQIVNRMRDFYRERQSGVAMTPVQIPELLANAVELTRPRWQVQSRASGPRIDLHVDTSPVPPVLGNEAELRQALVNLILNAIDAMPDGGALTLRATSHGDIVTLSVSDSGTGMTDEVKRECFRAFFTTKGEDGTGMGLSMVKEVCDSHGGRVELESALGKGTTVRLVLPAHHGEMRPVPVSPASRSRSLAILAVDDDPRALSLLQTALAFDGHRVDIELDPTRVPARVSTSHYDVVISDVAMPTLSGDKLSMLLSDMHPRLPVIMLTGTAEAEDLGARRDNVVRVLRKPLDIRQLRAVFAELGHGGIARD